MKLAANVPGEERLAGGSVCEGGPSGGSAGDSSAARDPTRRSRAKHRDCDRFFALGERDKGFDALRKAFDSGGLVIFTNADPQFGRVRSGPRLRGRVGRVGNSGAEEIG